MMKNIFLSLIVFLTLGNLNASLYIQNEAADNIINVDDRQQVLNYELIEEDGRVNIPEQLADNQGSVVLAENTQRSQNLLYRFLAMKYEQYKQIDEQDVNHEDWEISVKLDLILSMLDGVSNEARDAGNLELYNLIQQRYFPVNG